MGKDSVRVRPGDRVKLAKVDPGDTLDVRDRAEAADIVARGQERLAALQGFLAAERQRALVVVLQGMDASGKDGVVRMLFGGLNPMIVHQHAFGVPTKPELAHDFLWRVTAELPERGRIAVFNRSHYEDVLIVRVDGLVPESVWRPRYEAINEWEARLAANGTAICKFMLHISPDEQLQRQRERVQTPEKRWKFNADDMRKRGQWDDYMRAYEDVIELTGTKAAPWHVVPADHKWARDALIVREVVSALEAMDLPEPPVPADAPPELRTGGAKD
ncbi:MAG: PPK2 family polyphosphate kinase [Thermoleophilia bacterium]